MILKMYVLSGTYILNIGPWFYYTSQFKNWNALDLWIFDIFNKNMKY